MLNKTDIVLKPNCLLTARRLSVTLRKKMRAKSESNNKNGKENGKEGRPKVFGG